MALTTVNVTATILTAAGDPVEGAVVTARLDRADVDPDEGAVLPSDISETTDALGVAVLALWPNVLGSTGSRYRIAVTDSAGVLLWSAYALVPNAASDLESILVAASAALYLDQGRAGRIRADIMALMRMDPEDAQTAALVDRWIGFVGDFCARRPWFHLTRAATVSLAAGADIIDFIGDVARVSALFCSGGRAIQVTLSDVLLKRADAVARGSANAGDVAVYALEGRQRLHLWPAPGGATQLTLLYQVPWAVELLPDELEQMLVHGVIGRYARHFDRDALIQTPEIFEARFLEDLKQHTGLSFDAISTLFSAVAAANRSDARALSRLSGADTFLVPASLSGVGAVTIETGPYPLMVQ